MSDQRKIYDEDQIVKLKPREHVRLRPSMYFGGVDERALHNVVFEVIDVAVNEALPGYCHQIDLTLRPNDFISIRDDGRGLSVEVTKYGDNVLEWIMGEGIPLPHQHGEYRVGSGLLGAANALSAECTVEVARDGFLWRQSYQEGAPQTEVLQLRPLQESESTGTSITFRPDFTILEPHSFNYETLSNRVRELAYLVPELTITLRDEREPQARQEEFHFANGLSDYLSDLNHDLHPLHPPLSGSIELITDQGLKGKLKIAVDLALQYIETQEPRLLGYVNTNPVNEGVYIDAVPLAVSQSIHGYFALKPEFSREECLPGLTAIVHIKHPYPQFENQRKQKLLNSDVVSGVFAAVHEALTRWDMSKDTRHQLIEKCQTNRDAAPK